MKLNNIARLRDVQPENRVVRNCFRKTHAIITIMYVHNYKEFNYV